MDEILQKNNENITKMQEIWAKTLKALRKNGEKALFSLVSCLDDIKFTDSNIIITVNGTAEYSVLSKNKEKLSAVGGDGCIVITKKEKNEKINENLVKIQELFGSKLRK
jgi:hypothetical protein